MKRPHTHEELLLIIENDEFDQLELDNNQQIDVDQTMKKKRTQICWKLKCLVQLDIMSKQLFEEHVDNKQECVDGNLEEVEVQANSGTEEETDVNEEKGPDPKWRKVEETTNQRKWWHSLFLSFWK
ncbi:hypothetical protein QE152_g38143 [Popillia japonica]|uniref:Uncharacterized protein n=1 Tax=Popillia japonica TaxID=7064 RepID=A0AAW1I8E7_POPJA